MNVTLAAAKVAALEAACMHFHCQLWNLKASVRMRSCTQLMTKEDCGLGVTKKQYTCRSCVGTTDTAGVVVLGLV